MEMSPEYAQETANFLAQQGFTLDLKTQPVLDKHTQEKRYQSTQYRLTCTQQNLVLEVVSYPDDSHRYFLEIQHYFLASFSFELDSWKYRDEHIEFRYYTNPETGGALTFKLFYPDQPLEAEVNTEIA